MTSLFDDPNIASAVSNIVPRSERQPDLSQLQDTYVETGVLAQIMNYKNQIIYGRRGTGKTHVLRVLESELEATNTTEVIYIDVRLLGSAHLFQDEARHPAERCVAVFNDLLSLLQSHLLEIATDPLRDGSGIEEVSAFADFIRNKSSEVATRSIKVSEQKASASRLNASLGLPLSAKLDHADNSSSTLTKEVGYTEELRETIVFSEVNQILDSTLDALGIKNLVILIDEWTSLPVDMQPYVAEFLKRSLFTSHRITVKIGALEYRSRFTLGVEYGNPIGFELGPDIAADMDLDDYYVFDRNKDKVTEIFQDVLYKHVMAGLPASYPQRPDFRDATSLRTRLFTEKRTFVELVRAGEGVARDFLGIFASAFFRARTTGKSKIDLYSVEEAARDWYETDKSTVLTQSQRDALSKIITDVIGNRQTTMFMLRREDADHPMIRSLFDLRLLHLISRGYSDKENPGQRYNIYALDYGTYVDLKRTKAQPEMLEIQTGSTNTLESPGRIVPFADKRSIRRVILQTSIFD